jgi:hypothetical protein
MEVAPPSLEGSTVVTTDGSRVVLGPRLYHDIKNSQAVAPNELYFCRVIQANPEGGWNMTYSHYTCTGRKFDNTVYAYHKAITPDPEPSKCVQYDPESPSPTKERPYMPVGYVFQFTTEIKSVDKPDWSNIYVGDAYNGKVNVPVFIKWAFAIEHWLRNANIPYHDSREGPFMCYNPDCIVKTDHDHVKEFPITVDERECKSVIVLSILKNASSQFELDKE